VTELPASVRADPRRFDAAAIGTVLAVLASAAALGLGMGGTTFARDLGNILQVGAALAATVGCIWTAREARRSWRTGWYLIGASSAVWCTGQLVWTWLETVRGDITPFPSAADIFFLAAVPLAVAGLLCFPSSPTTQTGRARALLDGFIVASAVLFVSWALVLGPTLHGASGGAWSRVISLAYPAADVVVLTIVIITYVRCDSAGRVAVGLVGLAFAFFAIADSSFVLTGLHDQDVSELANTAWVAGYLLIALGAYWSRLNPPTECTLTAADDRDSRVQVLLPYVPLAAVLVLCIGEALVTDPLVVDVVVFWIGATLIAMLLVRQGVVIVENSRLARSLAVSNERLQYQVLHDGLTGLPNRPLFLDRMRMALSRMSRVEELVAVMFIDLDQFKPVNDTYGHEAGDRVLVTLGRRLTNVMRVGDTVSRFGGDEFLVLCEDVSGFEEATTMAQRVAAAIAEPMSVAGVDLVIHASIGMVITDSTGRDPGQLIREADAAMYEAKRKGRDRLELVDARQRTPVSH
jgi:diguanylate cyclase (GGDEF)-like protein